MDTRLFRSAVYLGLLAQVQSRICQAQGNLDQRQQAIATAVLFARGSASEELRTVPSEQIAVDVSQLLGKSGQLDIAAMGRQLRANVAPDTHGKCDKGLTGERALYARARCATATSRYYVEPGTCGSLVMWPLSAFTSSNAEIHFSPPSRPRCRPVPIIAGQ